MMFSRILKNQKGSALAISVVVFLFLATIIPGIMYMVNTQVLSTATNTDTVEAQYAAEAGIKRAIVGFDNKRTDWAWLSAKNRDIVKNTFVDGTEKNYVVSIMNKTNPQNELVDGNKPTPGEVYTITSDGYVGKAHKKVVATIRITSNSPFKYAAFSKGNMLIQNPLINGDICSDANIETTSREKLVNGVAYFTTKKIEDPSNISGGCTPLTVLETLDVNPLMATMPTLTMTGTDLTTTWKNGQWGGNTYPLISGSYFYDGSYDFSGHSYSIASGQDVTIYVKGIFTLMSGSKITLDGGNLTVYSIGDINFNGGSILGNINSNIQIFSNGTVKLSNNSFINGGTVRLLANNAGKSKEAIEFCGGSINKNLSGATSKVSANGLVNLDNASVISGEGTGMLVSTGNVNLNGGSAPSTVIVAEGDVRGNKGSTVAGIYVNGALIMTGTTVTYNDVAIHLLGLDLIGLPVTAISWSDH